MWRSKASPCRLSSDSYRVEWVETVRSHAGVLLDSHTYEATVTIQINPPTVDAVLLRNPGRRLHYFALGGQGGGRGGSGQTPTCSRTMRFTMKKILFLVCALALYAFPAFAASPAHGQTPDGWPPALQADSKPAAPEAIPEIDYLNPKTVPLTDKEKKALRLSGSWSRQGVEPVLTGGGKVVYVHGASLPTIVAAPMQVCDVELQPGETVHEIVVGDSSRWMVDSGTAGSGASATAHLFIKPGGLRPGKLRRGHDRPARVSPPP